MKILTPPVGEGIGIILIIFLDSSSFRTTYTGSELGKDLVLDIQGKRNRKDISGAD